MSTPDYLLSLFGIRRRRRTIMTDQEKIAHGKYEPFIKLLNEKNRALFEWMYDRSGFAIEETSDYIYARSGDLQLQLRNNSSDTEVFSQTFCDWQYLGIVNQAQLNKINVTTVVDLGANIGLSAAYLHQHFPAAKYICVEPDAGNTQMLKQNTAHMPGTVAVEAAIWNSNKTVYLDNRFRDGLSWATHTSEEGQTGDKPVAGITMQQLISDNALNEISILKVDIEGAEFMLFEGESYRDFLAITRLICIEIHDEAGDPQTIIQKLRDNGFVLWQWGESIFGLNTGRDL